MILKLIVGFLIFVFFLYTKLKSHKDKLDARYKKPFHFADMLFNPILFFIGKFVNPFRIGAGLSIDMTQVVLLLLLLILNICI